MDIEELLARHPPHPADAKLRAYAKRIDRIVMFLSLVTLTCASSAVIVAYQMHAVTDAARHSAGHALQGSKNAERAAENARESAENARRTKERCDLRIEKDRLTIARLMEFIRSKGLTPPAADAPPETVDDTRPAPNGTEL
jgi:hypothetical protein